MTPRCTTPRPTRPTTMDSSSPTCCAPRTCGTRPWRRECTRWRDVCTHGVTAARPTLPPSTTPSTSARPPGRAAPPAGRTGMRSLGRIVHVGPSLLHLYSLDWISYLYISLFFVFWWKYCVGSSLPHLYSLDWISYLYISLLDFFSSFGGSIV